MNKNGTAFTKFTKRIINDLKYRKEFSEKFWKKVFICDTDDCWEWLGCVAETDYGMMNLNNDCGAFLAHRIAWVLRNLKHIPRNHQICHTCDYRPCCNPNHLVCRTAKWNMQDCISKGRFLYIEPKPGSKHHNSKISEEDAQRIVTAFAPGAKRGPGSRSALAVKFGISGMEVYRIAHGIVRSVAGGVSRRTAGHLTNRQKKIIIETYRRGKRTVGGSREKLARRLRVPFWAITNFLSRRKHNQVAT